MKWSELTWLKTQDTYNAILNLPFLKKLADGSLDPEVFKFYIQQDALYLTHFGRVLAMIAAKSNQMTHSLAYIRYAEHALVVEKALHNSFFVDFQLQDLGEMQPVCHHYCHYLRSMAGFESIEVAMAATLPCFWIYKEVGNYIYQHHLSEQNPYQRWINTYASEEFNDSVAHAIEICDEIASKTSPENRAQMTEAFLRASALEYEFWRAADENILWQKFPALGIVG